MRTLRISWTILVLSGLLLIVVGYVVENVLRIGDVPGLIAVGTALILLAVSSMLNWAFKQAWESRHDRSSSANQDAPML